MNKVFKVLAALAFVISVFNSLSIHALNKKSDHNIAKDQRESLDSIYERTHQ